MSRRLLTYSGTGNKLAIVLLGVAIPEWILKFIKVVPTIEKANHLCCENTTDRTGSAS